MATVESDKAYSPPLPPLASKEMPARREMKAFFRVSRLSQPPGRRFRLHRSAPTASIANLIRDSTALNPKL